MTPGSDLPGVQLPPGKGSEGLEDLLEGRRKPRPAAGTSPLLRAGNVHDRPSWPAGAANALPDEPGGSEDCGGLEGVEHPTCRRAASGVDESNFREGSSALVSHRSSDRLRTS